MTALASIGVGIPVNAFYFPIIRDGNGTLVGPDVYSELRSIKTIDIFGTQVFEKRVQIYEEIADAECKPEESGPIENNPDGKFLCYLINHFKTRRRTSDRDELQSTDDSEDIQGAEEIDDAESPAASQGTLSTAESIEVQKAVCKVAKKVDKRSPYAAIYKLLRKLAPSTSYLSIKETWVTETLPKMKDWADDQVARREKERGRAKHNDDRDAALLALAEDQLFKSYLDKFKDSTLIIDIGWLPDELMHLKTLTILRDAMLGKEPHTNMTPEDSKKSKQGARPQAISIPYLRIAQLVGYGKCNMDLDRPPNGPEYIYRAIDNSICTNNHLKPMFEPEKFMQLARRYMYFKVLQAIWADEELLAMTMPWQEKHLEFQIDQEDFKETLDRLVNDAFPMDTRASAKFRKEYEEYLTRDTYTDLGESLVEKRIEELTTMPLDVPETNLQGLMWTYDPKILALVRQSLSRACPVPKVSRLLHLNQPTLIKVIQNSYRTFLSESFSLYGYGNVVPIQPNPPELQYSSMLGPHGIGLPTSGDELNVESLPEPQMFDYTYFDALLDKSSTFSQTIAGGTESRDTPFVTYIHNFLRSDLRDNVHSLYDIGANLDGYSALDVLFVPPTVVPRFYFFRPLTTAYLSQRRP